MTKNRFGIKGNICYSKSLQEMAYIEGGIAVCEDGRCQDVFTTLPEAYKDLEVIDYGDKIIIPGLTDLHVHAPQYVFRGLGLDMELLEWLDKNTFPQEAKYADPDYARKAYRLFVEDMYHGPNTRAVVFGTMHVAGTEILMELLEESGLYAYVGKVNMDRNAPEYLCEADADTSYQATLQWLADIENKYPHVKPIITPRFIPTCSDALMQQLGALCDERKLPVQSHLSENLSEIAWVQALCPDSANYGDAYHQFGMFGQTPTIMAHCVHSPEAELDMMKANGIFIAHCPQSNTNLSSGIAPIRDYLNRGLRVGLGSDVAGGYTTSILRAMADAIGVSKLYWRYEDQTKAPLKLEEAFYLGSMGGGAFFGQAGSFLPGYLFDAVIIDDTAINQCIELTLKERLERIMYLSDDRHICAKYVEGRQIL